MKQVYEQMLEELLHPDRLPFKQDQAQAWKSIQAKIASREDTPVLPMKRSFAPLRVAAGVAAILAVGAAFMLLAGSISIEGAEGSITETHLPDGSEVTLNGAGQLEFNKYLWSFQRSVALEGEAFFEVEKGSTFTVEGHLGDVEVLGTSFAVISTPGRLDVACKTGRVQVYHDSGKAIELKPGDAAAGNGSEVIAQKVEIESIAPWAEDDLIFDDISASDLFDTLEAVTGYNFVIEASLGMTYSGQFERDQPIEDILNIVCLPMNLSYRMNDGVITITNKNN